MGALTDREVDLLEADTQQSGTPIARADRLSTSSSTYGTVAIWTVGAGVTGDLHEVALTVDNFTATEWRLTIAGVEQFTDRVFSVAVGLPFRTNRLASADIVLLEARSPDNATAIVADGTITGTER